LNQIHPLLRCTSLTAHRAHTAELISWLERHLQAKGEKYWLCLGCLFASRWGSNTKKYKSKADVKPGLQHLGTNSRGSSTAGSSEDISTWGGRNDMRLEKTASWGASLFVLIVRYYQRDKLKGDEMGGSCGLRSFGEENTSTLRCINRIWNVLKNSVSASEKTHCINFAQQSQSSWYETSRFVSIASHRQTAVKKYGGTLQHCYIVKLFKCMSVNM
jgi:hypothetical protein